MSEELLEKINREYEHKEKNFKNSVLEKFLDLLESGEIRCAFKNTQNNWCLDSRVKQGILLAFKAGKLEKSSLGVLNFIDKHNLFPQDISPERNIRVVPGGSAIRRGAFVGQKVIIMPPSYINIGAYVDINTMIDSHVLIGSCAQIGQGVHISAGAQIGGVLDPIGANPVIIENNCLIGGNAGIFEGALIKKGAVIGAGVIITKSTRIFDLVYEREILPASYGGGLEIPENAVVVMGSRPARGDFAKYHGLNISTPIIIKYRDEKTDAKTLFEDILRK